MQSDLFTLDWRDFVRGLITAVYAGVGLAIGGILLTKGFDVFSADWVFIGKLAVNGAFGGFVGYLFKRFTSDEDGHVLGNESL